MHPKHMKKNLMKTEDLSGKNCIYSISDPKGTAFRGNHDLIKFWCTFEST